MEEPADPGEAAERIDLRPGESWGPVRSGRPHLVTNSGSGSATFLVLQGMGRYDSIPAT